MLDTGEWLKFMTEIPLLLDFKMYPIHNSQPIYRFSVRLNGIDTQSSKGSGKEEHQVVLLFRDWLINKIMGRMVVLENVSFEKYGRLLLLFI